MKLTIQAYDSKYDEALKQLCMSDWKTASFNLPIVAALSDYDSKVVPTYLAFADNILVGFVYGYALPDKLLIPEYMFVDPKYRKKGIGKKLLSILEKESNCTQSQIFYNKSLHNHYIHQGYTPSIDLEVAYKVLS